MLAFAPWRFRLLVLAAATLIGATQAGDVRAQQDTADVARLVSALGIEAGVTVAEVISKTGCPVDTSGAAALA